jgi:hypothetical protein
MPLFSFSPLLRGNALTARCAHYLKAQASRPLSSAVYFVISRKKIFSCVQQISLLTSPHHSKLADNRIPRIGTPNILSAVNSIVE